MRRADSIIYRRLFLAAAAMAFLRSGSLHFHAIGKFETSAGTSLLFMALRWVFYTAFFFTVFFVIDRGLHRAAGRENILFESDEGKVRGCWKDYIVFGISWLPMLLIKYPSALCWDTWGMIQQYRGGYITKAQSVFLTVVLGKLIEVFEKRGIPNMGIFIFSFLNYLLCVAAFGYAMNVLRRMRASFAARSIIFAVIILNPYILGYIGVIIKDLPYAVSVMAVIAALIDIDLDCKDFLRSPFRILLLIFMAANAILTRGNGLSIMLVLVLTGIVKAIAEKKTLKPVFILAAGFLTSGLLSANLDAGDSSRREILSLPFQQTARYVKYYGDEVTDEEREAINGVLDYERLGQLYSPRISDPVKWTYKGDDSKLPAYFKAWAGMFRKHPREYVEATWHQNYYLFTPEVQNVVLYQDEHAGYEMGMEKYVDLREQNFYEPIFKSPEKLQSLQKEIVRELMLIHDLPIFGLIGNTAFWNMLFMATAGFAMAYRLKMKILFAPLIMTTLFVIFGPVIQGHPRYFFPVVYAMPFVLMAAARKIVDRLRAGQQTSSGR